MTRQLALQILEALNQHNSVPFPPLQALIEPHVKEHAHEHKTMGPKGTGKHCLLHIGKHCLLHIGKQDLNLCTVLPSPDDVINNKLSHRQSG